MHFLPLYWFQATLGWHVEGIFANWHVGGIFAICVQYALDPEEYVFAALNLYLDIINLLLKILQILQELRKKDGN